MEFRQSNVRRCLGIIPAPCVSTCLEEKCVGVKQRVSVRLFTPFAELLTRRGMSLVAAVVVALMLCLLGRSCPWPISDFTLMERSEDCRSWPG